MKKFITFVLTAAMAVSALGVTVFADDAAPADSTATASAEDDKAEADKADAEAPEEGDKADAETPAEGDKADAETPAEGDKADAETPAESDKTDAAAPEDGDDMEDPEPLDASDVPAPVEAPAPAPAEKATATPTSAKVVIDGKEVAFAAYNIGGNNYFKLRDLAAALAGTNAEFDVVYDKELKAIRLKTLSSAEPTVYTGDGKIDATVVPGAKEAKLSTQRIILPTGAWLDATAAKLTGYNIDGYNYYKLREAGEIFFFVVDWDKEAKVITITTDEDAVFAKNDEPVPEVVKDEQNYQLKAGEMTEVSNVIFEKMVTVTLDPASTRDAANELRSNIDFSNCVFNGGLTVVGDFHAMVSFINGCSFGEGSVITFKEATPGIAKKITMDDNYAKIFVGCEGVTVNTESAIGVLTNDFDFVLNGAAYSKADLAPDADYLGVYSLYENDSMTYTKLALGNDDSVKYLD